MSSQPVRSYLIIAAAIVIAGVLISASVFVALQNEKSTVTVTCTGSAAGLGNASVTDCARGLILSLSATPIIAEGSNQTVTVSVSNDLRAPSIVNYTSYPSLPHGLSMSNLEVVTYVLPLIPGCGYFGSQPPAFVMVLNASGYPMQLNDEAPSVSSCLSSGPPKSYSFTASETVSSEISIGGYWTSHDTNEPWVNATYHQFSAGSYTLLAFDPWGQTVELNFSVDLRDATTGTTSSSCSGYPPGGNCPGTYNYTFTVSVNYTGPWKLTYLGYNNLGKTNPTNVSGSYTGSGFFAKNVTMTSVNTGGLSLCATAQKLDGSSSTLILTVTGYNETSLPYGSVSYCGGVVP